MWGEALFTMRAIEHRDPKSPALSHSGNTALYVLASHIADKAQAAMADRSGAGIALLHRRSARKRICKTIVEADIAGGERHSLVHCTPVPRRIMYLFR